MNNKDMNEIISGYVKSIETTIESIENASKVLLGNYSVAGLVRYLNI